MLAAGRALGREIIVLEVRPPDFEAAFVPLVERRADALIVGGFTIFNNPRNRDKILELVARHNIPAMYPNREYAVHGGLMSYNHSEFVVAIRQLGSHYVGRILKGAKPTDLPVMQPTKFELIVNLKTAKALGLEIPATLLALADEVIE
jgi:putative tryptophan/tyrosine transport system substrate-binding protein